jgi:hypothetical protein
MQCTWRHIGRCTAAPDYQLELCVDCGAAFHNTCTVNGVFALFGGQKELEDAPDKRCGRCGDWQLGGAQAAAAERMDVDEVAEPLFCVIDELEVVTVGKYRSQDRVLCLVPGCPLAKGDGLLRDSARVVRGSVLAAAAGQRPGRHRGARISIRHPL